MAITQEFKEFILRGKVIDLAVGVAVGGAFTKVIETIVSYVFMPFVSLFGNEIDFSHLKWILRAANPTKNISEVAIQYGLVLNTMITFLIVGFAVFTVIKIINKIYQADTSDQAKITNELLREMRDMMIKQKANLVEK